MKKYEGETGTAYIFWMGADSHFQLVPLFPICYPSSLFNLETCPKEVSICVRLPQQQNNYQWPRITASNVLTVPPAVQLSSLACDADSASRSGSLQQPAHQAAQGASTTQQNKVHEKTLLIHMCLQYILSTSLAGRPNNAFSCRIAKWIILSVLGVTFVSLGMWSLFSLLQTWARCFPVVQIYARYLSFSSPLPSPPPSSFLLFFPPLTFSIFPLHYVVTQSFPNKKSLLFLCMCVKVGKAVAQLEKLLIPQFKWGLLPHYYQDVL